jgi:hypothetical protein
MTKGRSGMRSLRAHYLRLRRGLLKRTSSISDRLWRRCTSGFRSHWRTGRWSSRRGKQDDLSGGGNCDTAKCLRKRDPPGRQSAHAEPLACFTSRAGAFRHDPLGLAARTATSRGLRLAAMPAQSKSRNPMRAEAISRSALGQTETCAVRRELFKYPLKPEAVASSCSRSVSEAGMIAARRERLERFCKANIFPLLA